MDAKRGADRVATERAANSASIGHQAGIVQVFSSRVGAMTSRLWLRPAPARTSVNRSHLSLTSAVGLERDRVHLLHQLVIPGAVVALARLQHVELGALFEVLDHLGRIGGLEFVHRLREVLGRQVVAPRLVLRRLAVFLGEGRR